MILFENNPNKFIFLNNFLYICNTYRKKGNNYIEETVQFDYII